MCLALSGGRNKYATSAELFFCIALSMYIYFIPLVLWEGHVGRPRRMMVGCPAYARHFYRGHPRIILIEREITIFTNRQERLIDLHAYPPQYRVITVITIIKE